MNELIVTADDVGLHRGMTEGAIRAHQLGIVTACSVVANGAAFEHAAERLHDLPGLAIGVHLTLVEERPVAEDVDSLVASSGLFHEKYVDFLPRYLAHIIKMADVEKELRAQLERVLGAGLDVTHLNSHQHLHMLPRIFEVVQRLAGEYRIGYVRIVDEKARGASSRLRGWSVAALSRLGRRARAASGVKTNHRTLGVENAGRVSGTDHLIAALEDVDGLTELVAHPALSEEELKQTYGWGYAWEAETTALCDPRLKKAIEERGIRLVKPGGGNDER